ncbi:PLC-like phosphodiesterase [Trichoderma citrinoviride]|uniref:glycerophosphodiester phosphodiesterase n=1 Tax=Trichoderma citrinoviride TaxID=58853 RepID=A0A2T4B918_9HYPO|nr:PLC-like phosphodiesterase [Trichoderma citrinoviride]PTB65827.1 PLC-like phosphodiesterase [Trichoderma citrinoviride]
MLFTPLVAAVVGLAAIGQQIELGPRPYYLVDNMSEGPLKAKLESCKELKMRPSSFSIAHRGGAPLQFPEHSRESNLAGARMGAGILECDVAFTADLELVCRHSQCDLHTTTNVVDVPELNAKCTQPFTPANGSQPAAAKCCTSDLTLAEFKSLCSKMDAFNASATTPADYLGGILPWRTDLYNTCGTLMSLKEHIAMTRALGLQFTPELKTPEVPMPFRGGNYTQQRYAQQFIDTFKEAGIPPSRVYVQSFLYDDILYWLRHEPAFARQAMFLDSAADLFGMDAAVANLTRYKRDGVVYVAPPLPYLVTARDGKIVPSEYANKAKALGLKILTWSLERSGPIAEVHALGDYFYGSIQDVVKRDGDIYTLVDVLARQVGVAGMFSDWTATVTYYANCFGLGL